MAPHREPFLLVKNMKIIKFSLISLSLLFGKQALSKPLQCQTIDIEDDPFYVLDYDEKTLQFKNLSYGICNDIACSDYADSKVYQSLAANFPLGKVVFPRSGFVFSFEKFSGINGKCITGELIQFSPEMIPTFAKLECRDPYLDSSECWPVEEGDIPNGTRNFL